MNCDKLQQVENPIEWGLYYDKHEVDEAIAELKAKLYEADKVIAEKDAEIARLKDICKVHIEAIESMGAGLLQDYDEIHHQKYKRCLAMARRCFTKSNYHFVLARHGEDVKENNRKSILYSKWRNRWLKIAEKFKTNSTINRKEATNAL